MRRISLLVTDILLLLPIWLRNAYSRSIICGRCFGGLIPKCSRIVESHKRQILGRKHAFWRIDCADRSRSRNATWSAEESKKKGKKETQRCDESHICPDHRRCATPTIVVMWCGVPDIVNHAKSHQNRFRGLRSPRGQNLPFFLCSTLPVYALYNRLGLPPNVWCWKAFVNTVQILLLNVNSRSRWMNEWNEWKCSDLKCIQKPGVGLV